MYEIHITLLYCTSSGYFIFFINYYISHCHLTWILDLQNVQQYLYLWSEIIDIVVTEDQTRTFRISPVPYPSSTKYIIAWPDQAGPLSCRLACHVIEMWHCPLCCMHFHTLLLLHSCHWASPYQPVFPCSCNIGHWYFEENVQIKPSDWLSGWLITMTRVLLDKMVLPQLVNKYPMLY